MALAIETELCDACSHAIGAERQTNELYCGLIGASNNFSRLFFYFFFFRVFTFNLSPSSVHLEYHA